MREISTDGSGSGRQFASDAEASEWEAIVHRSFECDDELDIVREIIEAVAAAEGVDPMMLGSSLFEAVNVVAIEALFFDRTSQGQQRHCTGTVHFRYRGFRVTVTSDGQVTVAEPDRGDDE